MKLIRFGEPGAEKPGILDGGTVRDLSAVIADWNPDTINDDTLRKVAGLDLSALPPAAPGARIGPCVGKPGKLVCIGLNYSDHAAEAGLEVPPEPVVFFKATSAVSGPRDPVVIPRNSTKVDWEVELGIVIGRETRYVSEEVSMDHVAGYCIVNDVSEREFQIERSGQWVKGKSCDSFGPIGPWLVTRDEVADPQALDLWLKVNGEFRQNGTTATMVFGVRYLVSYLSQFMSLQPGDVISTGTPPGVGLGMKPPRYLEAGDIMELGVQGLGEQRQEVVPPR